MLRSLKCTVVAAGFILFGLIFLPASAKAQGVQDFVIDQFSATYDLSNEDKQGLLKIEENISLTYSGQNRGILRAIPATYQDVDTHIEITDVRRDGKPEPYITYRENDNTVLKIGDPNVYITGQHSYTIRYSPSNVIRFNEGYDELYWDINGDQWLQPFTKVEAKLTSAAQLDDREPQCFSGTFGSLKSDCSIIRDTNWVSASTVAPLGVGETMTISVAYKKGYFSEPTLFERYYKLLYASPVVIAQMLVYNSARKKWLLFGKDYSARGVEVPYFGRPKSVSVMQAGYVLENKLTQRLVSAAMIDLAIRGYIKIAEIKKRWSVKHELTLLKAADSALTEDESLLLRELMGDTVGATVKLEDKKQKLYKTFEALAKSIDSQAVSSGYYELSPRKSAGVLGKQIALGVVGVIVGFLLGGFSSGLTAVTGVLAMAGTLVYTALMTKRSRSGNMLVEHMKGLKLYLSRAEKDRIAQQDAVAAPLSKDSGQPVRDVAFFEKLLPFAIAVGVEKTWAKAFSDLYTQPPDWYSGNWNTFSTAALVSSLNSTTTAATQSFSAPSSSGSSGFPSGGGFSGGGGGGGGGGGW